MIHREFSTREKILLLVLAAVLLAVGYFRFFLAPIQSEIRAQQQRQEELANSVLLEQTRLLQLEKMQKKIDKIKANGTVPDAEVPKFDNIEKVMLQLNGILIQAQEYNLSFGEISEDDNGIVSRPVDLSFVAGSYTSAREIINQLYQCPYRCAVSDISEQAETDLASDITVHVDLTITFFEKRTGTGM